MFNASRYSLHISFHPLSFCNACLTAEVRLLLRKTCEISRFFSSLPKQLSERSLVPSASRLPCLFWQSPYYRRHVTEYRKRHLNLVNARWLRKIRRGN